MSKHKTLGQVYTPEWVVIEILNLVNYRTEKILNSYILEPSCGDGAFLIEIVKRYIFEAKRQSLSDDEIRNGLEKYIYGIELDEGEYQKCIGNLNEIVKSSINFECLNWNILNENTLHIFKNHLSFFDYIVGNPPYIRIHNLDLDTRSILKENFQFSEGTIDIYLSFFEMGFQMIKPKGFIGYITPNSYLHNSSYTKFREYLKDKKAVNTLIDFKANKIFKGFSTYTAISIIENSNTKDSFTYKELIDGEMTKINDVLYAELNMKDWSFTDKANEDFLRNLYGDKNTFINELFNVQYGFATLRDKIFIGSIQEVDNKDDLVLFNDHLMESVLLKTVIKGSKHKGEIDHNQKIIFPYKKILGKYIVIPEDEMKSSYPNCYDYFLKNDDELRARDLDKGALWYEFGRSQGVQSIHNEKIVLSTLVNDKINYHRVPNDVLMYSGIFIVRKEQNIDWSIIEDVLNSDEFFQFIRLTGKDFSGGYKSITTKQIKEFKINYINNDILIK